MFALNEWLGMWILGPGSRQSAKLEPLTSTGVSPGLFGVTPSSLNLDETALKIELGLDLNQSHMAEHISTLTTGLLCVLL